MPFTYLRAYATELLHGAPDGRSRAGHRTRADDAAASPATSACRRFAPALGRPTRDAPTRRSTAHARCADPRSSLTHLFFSEDLIELGTRPRDLLGLHRPRSCACGGPLERHEPYGVWGGEMVVDGRVVADKRGRGGRRRSPGRGSSSTRSPASRSSPDCRRPPADPVRWLAVSGPLTGIRVLDFSRVLAGPHCTRMLSDLGADVIKLEPPDGDLTRYASPRINGLSTYFVQQNAGKRNISIDLGSPRGAEIAIALAGTSDVVVENYRAGVMKRLGLGVEELTGRFPRLDLRVDLRLRRDRSVGRPAGVRVGRRRRGRDHQDPGRRPRRRLRQRPAEPRRHLHRAGADDRRARRAVPARADGCRRSRSTSRWPRRCCS